ncbi:MAG: DUF362 domain-containing protein [bacterium]
MKNSNVIIRPLNNYKLDDIIAEILEFCNWKEIIQQTTNVVIKPNLCTERPDQIKCANTSIEVITAVCKALKTRTDNVIIGESDGMRYKAEQAFENSGVYKMASELGIKVINFSKDELVEVDHPLLKGWGFSKTYLDADVFISLPVLKTHATTVFTGTLKNQWGCIPRYDRILLHKYLHELIADINLIKKPDISIMDGIVGMQGRGPINGYPINLGVLLGSRDPVALDAVSMRLIGLDPYKSEHVVLSAKKGLGEIDPEKIIIDGDFDVIKTKVEPAQMDWAIKLLNLLSRSKFITNNLILNDNIFYPVRRMVVILRKILARVAS